LEEVNARTVEALQQEEDKARHLGKCKSKLEAELVECEEQLQLEKKGRADVDRVRRKIQTDLKVGLIIELVCYLCCRSWFENLGNVIFYGHYKIKLNLN
jgi:hypothetical protein